MSQQEQKAKGARPRFIKINETILVTDNIIGVERLYVDKMTRTNNLVVTLYDNNESQLILIEFISYSECQNWFNALTKVAEDNVAYSPEDL